jgi:hypothetical protein
LKTSLLVSANAWTSNAGIAHVSEAPASKRCGNGGPHRVPNQAELSQVPRGQRRCSTLVSNPGAALGGKHAREGRKTTLPIAPADLTGPTPWDPERQGGRGRSFESSGWLSPG